jgi:hypothetical protein
MDFTGTFDPVKFLQIDLIDNAAIIPGLKMYYHKVVAGLLAEMTAGEKTAADTEYDAYMSARYNGSPQIKAIFANEAALPSPPGDRGYLVGVINLQSSGPGLAISTNSGWVLFKQSGSI